MSMGTQRLLVLMRRLKIRRLAPSATEYPTMNVCQINNSWEQYDNYLVSCLYSVQYWRLYVKYDGRRDVV
jgi:hypothetical protein